MPLSLPCVLLCAVAVPFGAIAGPLDPPPGPIASTPPIEARTGVSATTTPGDADSVFKITQPGSYYLVGEVVGAPGRMGIEVSAAGAVTIDLNGFTVRGVAGALGGVVVTAPAGTSFVHLRNGAIADWPQWGALGVTTADTVKFTSNAGGGISTATRSSVTNCIAISNGSAGSYGIQTGASSAVFDCVANANGGASGGGGIFIGPRSQVRRCIAASNATTVVGAVQGYGIQAHADSVVADCRVDLNGVFGTPTGGIRAIIGTTVTGCSLQGNFNVGIQCEGEGMIAGNNVSGTPGPGIFSVSSSNQSIQSNNVFGNTFGIRVTGSGNTIVKNSLRSNGTAFDIAPGNDVGPIGVAATSTSPWANISN